jgi:hypothetical protein
MIKSIQFPLIAIVSIAAAACGGGGSSAKKSASAESVDSAVTSPNATVDLAGTEAAVAATIEGASAAGSAPGVPSFGFAAPAQIRGGFPLPGDIQHFVANAAGSAMRESFAQTCAQKQSMSQEIDGDQINQQGGASGCTASGKLKFEYTCSNNNNTIRWKFTYTNFSFSCAQGGNNGSFKINGKGDTLIGLSSDETKWGIRAFYDMNGEFSGDGEGTDRSFDYNGGYVVVYPNSDGEDSYKALLMAIVAGIEQDGETRYYVFFSGDKDNPTLERDSMATGKAFIIKGGNGEFTATCQKSDKVQCALWNREDKSLVSSSIEPAPAYPSETDAVTINLENMLD